MNPFKENDSLKWDAETILKVLALNNTAEGLADEILKLPASRERSLALTNLEQAMMWAGKAAMHQDTN